MLERYGRTPYGENRYRVVWGPSRYRIMGGYWEDAAKNEYRLAPIYGPTAQWVLEHWRPAVIFGSPQIWDTQTTTPEGFWGCGPFPAHGDFIGLQKFSAKNARDDGGILPELALTAYAVMEHRLLQFISEADRQRTYTEEAMRKERAQDASFDDMWKEAQLSRPGLSIGAGGAFNKQQEIDDYARRIERANAFVDGREFRHGFKQQ